jgi:hypothetical protein
MIKAVLKTLVSKMNANGDSFDFLLGLKGIQNLRADELTLPVVLFDMPIKSRPSIKAGGAFKREYILVALFMYKSQTDSDSTDLDEGSNDSGDYDYYTKAAEAERNFILLLDAEKDLIESWSVGDDYQIPHHFDAELSGIVLPFRVVLRNFDPVCLT